jgi:hypothetical protein
MSVRIGSIALCAAVLLAAAGLQSTSVRAQEDECLAAPNARAPQGSHWYYRTDRVTHQKCWHLREQDQSAQQLPPGEVTASASAASAPSAPTLETPVADTPPASSSDAGDVQRVNAAPAEATLQAPAAPMTAPRPADDSIWPNPAPLIAKLKPAEPVAAPAMSQAVPSQAVPSPIQPAADAAPVAEQPADRIEPDRAPGESALSTRVSPVGMALIAALALALIGIVSRLVMGISARRHRVYVDHRGRDWDSEPEPMAWYPEPPAETAAGPVDARQIDELETALRQFSRDRRRHRRAAA